MAYKHEGWLVILDKDKYIPKSGDRKYDRIRFTYLHDNFTESKSANYSSTAILGRSEPVRGYLGSSPRAVNLQLMIPIEGDDLPRSRALKPSVNSVVNFNSPDQRSATFMDGQYVTEPPAEESPEVIFTRKHQVMDFVRSLLYPHYGDQSQNVVFPPPRVQVQIGTWFLLIGIVTNYSMTHQAPWAANGDMTPYYTELTLTVEECDQPYSFQDVYGGALRPGGSNRVQLDGPTSSRI